MKTDNGPPLIVFIPSLPNDRDLEVRRMQSSYARRAKCVGVRIASGRMAAVSLYIAGQFRRQGQHILTDRLLHDDARKSISRVRPDRTIVSSAQQTQPAAAVCSTDSENYSRESVHCFEVRCLAVRPIGGLRD